MSSDAYLTDDDRALLEHLESEVDEEATAKEVKTHLTQLRADLRNQRAEFRKFRRRVEERLDSLEQRSQAPDQDEDQPPLYAYARLDPEDREEELTTAERIAVTIHDAWIDIAWTLGGGSNYAGERNEARIGVDTKTTANAKYSPSRLRYRLKKELDWEPAHNQIYRGLKKLADISGGEEVVDATTGRVHIRGGEYEYREMATADGNDTKRVLWRTDQ